jgi:hypothetical protein
VRLRELFRHLSRPAPIGDMRHVVSRLAQSGIFLPYFHVPDFSLFLRNREMRVQRDGIFVSSSNVSLLSYGAGEKVSLTKIFVENLK